ncbi:hypothetical protein ACVXHB_22055 [Escherichia coli]
MRWWTKWDSILIDEARTPLIISARQKTAGNV